MEFMLLGLLGGLVVGSAVVDLLSDDDPPQDEGQELHFDGSEKIVGTEGNDTLTGTHEVGLIPATVDLLGGDDTAVIDVEDLMTIHGGDGNDSITVTGVTNTVEGGAGNDTLSGDDSNLLYGDEGDDVLNFTQGSYDNGDTSIVDGGDGNDTLNITANALVPNLITNDISYAQATGGDGEDTFNVTYVVNELRPDLEPTTEEDMFSVVKVMDFNPDEDSLTVEVDQRDIADDRDVTLKLDTTEESDGTYTSHITLTFAPTSAAAEAVIVLTVKGTGPVDLNDIKLVGI